MEDLKADNRGREAQKSLLREFLADRDDAFRARVLDIVVRHGMSVDDPSFLIHMEMATTQVMCLELPAALALERERARELHDRMIREAIVHHRELVAAETRDLIARTEALHLKNPRKVLLPGLALFTAVFCLGAIAGIGASVSMNYLAGSGRRLMTLSEAALLDWARGDEGRRARQLYEWNRDYLDSGNCQEQITALGVRLSMGTREVSTGFCALWVVPPPSRR